MPGTVSEYFLRHVPQKGAGRVHSVFATSFNILCANGFLMHVGAAPAPLSCLGANLAPARLAGLLGRVQQDDRVVFRPGALRIYDAQGVSEVDYASLAPVDLAVGPRTRPDAALAGALRAMELPGRIGLAWDAALAAALDALCRPQNVPAEAFAFLLGRGLGLTPSGDDILTGYGAGLWAFGEPAAFCRALRAALHGQTTDVSLAYLGAMADGYVNADYRALFDAVREGRRGDYPALLEAAARHGHTSGCDSLLGLYTALRACGAV